MSRPTPPRTYQPPTQGLPGSGSTAAARRVEREDLVTFVNAAFCCTGQREFYGDAGGQAVSIDFLHEYICGNYRSLYVRALAVGVNHFNTGKIIVNTLATGASVSMEQRRAEGQLCAAALRRLPAPQAYRTIRGLVARRVNNRRTRAIVRDFLATRGDLALDAVKYRPGLRAAVRHGHLRLPPQLGRFLFGGRRAIKGDAYEHPLLDAYRRAHYEQRAVYELPYTVAEGFAAKHKIPRARFLEGIEPRMTKRERERLQVAAGRAGVTTEVDLRAMSLTRLCSFVVTRSQAERRERADELHQALLASATREVKRQGLQLGEVAAVLDCSYSSSGSREKYRRPLAVALAAHYLLGAASTHYRPYWSSPTDDGRDEPIVDPALLVRPRGPTDLATPILRALSEGGGLLVVVSDGYDNDPPGAAGEVLRVFRERFDPRKDVAIVHLNPVFDSDDYSPRALTPTVPTIGVRDAEDIPSALAFARFATDDAWLSDLHAFLERRVNALLSAGGASR